MLSLLSCKDVVEAVIAASGNKKENVADIDFKKVSVGDLFTISLPDYLKEMDNLNDEAVLQYGNIYKESYIVVIDEPKQEFADTFKGFNEYDDDLSLIDNYLNAQTNFLRESIQNFQTIPYNVDTINGLPARQMMVTGKVDGLNISYLVGFVEGKERIFMIMTWTLKERANKYEDIFNKIIGSFELAAGNSKEEL